MPDFFYPSNRAPSQLQASDMPQSFSLQLEFHQRHLGKGHDICTGTKAGCHADYTILLIPEWGTNSALRTLEPLPLHSGYAEKPGHYIRGMRYQRLI